MKVILLSLLSLIMVLTLSEANAMRCKNQIVVEGYNMPRVLKTCGEPDFKYTYYKEAFTGHIIYGHQGYGEKHVIIVDEWYYDFGPRSFLYTLTFENGKLLNIEAERSAK